MDWICPMEGTVFNIQRFSIHDGPGIRSTVFLKGCTLHCFWCHNPESSRIKPDLQFYPERCIGCGKCFAVCPNGAHVMRDGQHVLLRERCEACGLCAQECYSETLTLAGKVMSVDEVVQDVLRDREFYRTTGGGVTLSGGEPVMQPEFSHAILARCHAEGIHTVVETAANVPWKDLALVLSETDLVLVDVKVMDPARHREAIGATNDRIVANIRRMDGLGLPIIARIPVVPTVNDTADDIRAIAAFIRELNNVQELVLLPFHRLADGKYRSLGLDHRARDLTTPSAEHLAALADAARETGLTVKVG
jgi:pyruvate formate lyase activating enzyme